MNEIMKWFQDSAIWATVDASFTMVSILITAGTFIMVIKNYQSNKKQLERVEIIILNKPENKSQAIPSYILRKNFNRVEVKGILRGLHKGSEYEIDYIENPNSTFFQDIYKIQTAQLDALTIPISENDKFELKKHDDIH